MKDRKPPFPFPDVPAWPPKFPTSVHPETPIVELASWWLRIECDCPRYFGTLYPCRLMSAELGWSVPLVRILDRLKCSRCGARPVSVKLVEGASSGPGGTHAPQELLLRRYR